MSSISPVGGTPIQATGVDSTSPSPASYLDGVASLLSMSPSELQSSLASGQSISDIATQKGVSTSSVVQVVEQQIEQQRAAQGQQPLSSQALDQAANRVVNRHHHHHHGAPPASSSTDATGTDPTSETSTASGLPSTLDLFA